MASPEGVVDAGKEHDPKFLLDYLDREMASLQILLAFMTSVLALSLGLIAKSSGTIANRIHDGTLLFGDIVRLVLSAAFLIASTYLFFRQRETIAYSYWQISLAASGYKRNLTVAAQLKKADSWLTWICYRWAWKFLTAAFIEITSVVFRMSFHRLSGEQIMPRWESWVAYLADAIIVVIALWGGWQIYAFHRYPYDDHPMRKVLNDFRGKNAH